ncbi:MAG: tRNA (adenosine(37)-N6)-threonylcarbamoyltransferase complex dimerization subunit type 1 TsaB [Acidimicrobiales bacterium]
MEGGTVTLLAIESATDTVGVALIRADGGSAERVHEGGRAHAELLAPAIEEVCALSGGTVADVDQLAVDTGPGLFTGLRVGVATAKALAQALGICVLGVSSLDVLAAAAAERFEPGRAVRVVSVVDARRGEVFAASYRFDEAVGPAGDDPFLDEPFADDPFVDPRSVCDDRLEPIGPDTLVNWLADLGKEAGRVTVVGDGAVRYRQLLSADPSVDLGSAEELSAPSPLVLAGLARRRLAAGDRPVPPGVLLPDYRRPADARINWEQRAPRIEKTAASPDGRGQLR